MSTVLSSPAIARPLIAQTSRPARRLSAVASLLPALVLSGLITLVITAVLRLMWMGVDNYFWGAWMEAWLTAWPIAFPLTYLMGPALLRLALRLSAPPAPAVAGGGLGCADVIDVSAHVSEINGFTVLRNLQPQRHVPCTFMQAR